MDTQITKYREQVQRLGPEAIGVLVTNEETRLLAASWLVKVRDLRVKIEQEGQEPIQRIKKDLRTIEGLVRDLKDPLIRAERHLKAQINDFVMKEQQAARQLQEEENRRVLEAQQRMIGEETPSEDVVLPEFAPTVSQTIKSETGENVSTRMLNTFHVGKTIINGEIVDKSANLSPTNADFKGIPLHLFEINLPRLKAWIKSNETQGTCIVKAKKASTVAMNR